MRFHIVSRCYVLFSARSSVVALSLSLFVSRRYMFFFVSLTAFPFSSCSSPLSRFSVSISSSFLYMSRLCQPCPLCCLYIDVSRFSLLVDMFSRRAPSVSLYSLAVFDSIVSLGVLAVFASIASLASLSSLASLLSLGSLASPASLAVCVGLASRASLGYLAPLALSLLLLLLLLSLLSLLSLLLSLYC